MSLGQYVPNVDLHLCTIIPTRALDRLRARAWVRYVRQYKLRVEVTHGEEVAISLAELNCIHTSDADPDPPPLTGTSDHAHLAAMVLRHLDILSVWLLDQIPPLPAIPIPLIQAELHPDRAGDYVIRAVVADAMQCMANVDRLVATVVRDRFTVASAPGGLNHGYVVAHAIRFLGMAATPREVMLASRRLADPTVHTRQSGYTVL